MHVIRRQTCRACGSHALSPVIDLGEQHLQGSFIKPGTVAPLRKLPMALVRCDPHRDENACGLLQALYTVPPEMMYRSYWYKSGVNVTMREHLRDLTFAARKFIGRIVGVDVEGDARPARVLDIGCNDGTLLDYYPTTWDRWGVDPSNIAASVKPPINVVNDFFPSLAADQAFRGTGRSGPTQIPGQDMLYDDAASRFDIITAVAMFYDLEDPVSFADAVASWLLPEGVFIFEMSYLPAMLAQNSYDTICHEHIEYYSLAAIEHVMNRANLRVVKVEENAINGGSLRCYAVPVTSKRGPDASVLDMRAREFDLQLDTDEPYKEFQKRAEIHKADLLGLLRRFKGEGAHVHVYGASTKGNTLLQWCGIDRRLVDYAADRNPDKDGTRTPGTEIPIITEEASRRLNPDYYLVLPWHFREEFLARELQALRDGTKFIFPLPKIEIVGG